jgi:hypothetical protein
MNRCPHSDSVGAFVLKALDEPAAGEFLTHLAECRTCRREVAELQVVADTLPLAAPQVAPPDAVRDRIMAAVQSEAELRAASAGVGRRVGRGGEAPRRLPRLGLHPALVGGSLACAAAIAVVIAVSGGRGEAKTFSASLAPAGSKVTVKVSDNRAELSVADMPSPAAGKVYEVWLIREGGAPRPTHALFGVRSDGQAVVKIPERLGDAQAVWVTAEPASGSAVPTGTPVIKADVS